MSVRTVTVDGHELLAKEPDSAGAGTAGPGGSSFLLVHGIGMGSGSFAELADELSAHGRVVAVELPGFGETPEPAEALPMEATGALLLGFIRELSLEQPVLVGHSMGTQVVAEAAVQAPELVGPLVLIAPVVNRHERTPLGQGRRMVQDLFGESPRVLAIGMKYYAKSGPRWFLAKLRQMMLHRLEDVAPRIRARTLVIRGEKDRVCPRAWVEEVAALIPGARMAEIPGRGHETMMTEATGVARLIVAHARGEDD